MIQEKKKHKICLTVNIFEGYWVFTLDAGKSWRETKYIDCFPAMHKVCINGVIYIQSDDYFSSKLKIVVFDIRAETFKVLAGLRYSSNYRYKLIEVKAKLAVLEYKKYLPNELYQWSYLYTK